MAAPEAAGDTTATLLRVLEALYQTTDRSTRREASKWLEAFQQSMEAWQISDRLLHDESSSMEVRYFCAQTLRTKVQRDFEELPPGSTASLRASLLELLAKFRNGPAAVRTQLCLAIAALAAHTAAGEWGEGGVVYWLRQQLAAQPESAPALLELLTVVVQEVGAHKLAVRPERRRQFSAELVACAPDVLALLAACHAAHPADPATTEAALHAFTAWLRFSNGLSAATLMAHRLVPVALEGLQSADMFEPSVEAVCELIRFSVSGGPAALAANMPLVQLLVPRIMALLPRFSAALKVVQAQQQGQTDAEPDEDEDTMKAMARLFAEIGEAYVDLIASGSPESMMIAEALVQVTSHPDFDIASTTFNFWHALGSHLTTRPRHEENVASDAAAHAERERRLALFKPIFELLVSLVSFRVRYPPGHESWRSDEKADFKQTRYAVADVLTDVLYVLGGERLLQLLAQPLFQIAEGAARGQEYDWRALEASLYCIRAIAGSHLLREQTILPQLMALLPMLPPQPHLLYTASLTIAAYCDWIAAAPNAPSMLPPLLTLLTNALGAGEDAAPAAALALKHICDASRQHLLPSIDPLLQLYNRVMVSDAALALQPEDELQIVEALSVVVSVLPPDQCPKAVSALLQPLTATLQQVVTAAAQAPGGPAAMPAAQYVVPIDRIANIFRYVSQNQPLADAFQQLWPLFRAVFAQKPTDMRVMERLCRACKYAIRGGQTAMAPVLAPLLQELQVQYEQHQQPCLLYVASEIIKVFGSDANCAAYLQQLIAVLFARTTASLQSLDDFTLKPDVADDCFLLASRCMRYCGHLFVPTPAFLAVLDSALAGLLVQHREACKSVLSFLKDVFDFPLSERGRPFRATIEAAVLPRGPTLCRLLLAAATGGLPESRNDEVVELLVALQVCCGGNVLQWLQPILDAIPAAAASHAEKMALLQAVAAAANASTPRDATNHTLPAVEDLSGSCRRSKRVLDAVQQALLGGKVAGR
ncbi:hypothetical protein CLOM_g3730 [Closterium sp. NIES-68]|nr:hypothetical protein CLOM_g3730 [Closterium sp. NIES-68]GJP80935.1 hypothetical protein CLOP_g11130 [Closterium sp. NIES-67]